MGITNANKEVLTNQIECGNSFRMRLSLTAEPNIVENPTDIVLVLDRSGSMTGSALTNLKNGAKKFIEIIDEATDSSGDCQIGNGSRIGIVSFAATAVQDTQLITSVAELNAAVDALVAENSTNHADAFTKATELFDPNSTNAKVIVMFTDGFTTVGNHPAPVADVAKAQGIIIYVIGLSGNGGIDEQVLNEWASDPDSSYVAITPDDEELEELFENLARNIVNPGATNIVVNDTINPCFRILSITAPTKGTATLTDSTSLEWTIDELGVTASEGAVLEFTVEHIGDCTGVVEVNDSIEYNDTEGNVVTFPTPTIEIECGIVIVEECPIPVDITINGCEDTVVFDAGDLILSAAGRILQVDVTLRNVCPNKRIALAAIVTEEDVNGQEFNRGMKTMVIPAHNRESCQDITVRCIKFVLSDGLDDIDLTNSMCNERNFKVRFISNYIDTDFVCCNIVL